MLEATDTETWPKDTTGSDLNGFREMQDDECPICWSVEISRQNPGKTIRFIDAAPREQVVDELVARACADHDEQARMYRRNWWSAVLDRSTSERAKQQDARIEELRRELLELGAALEEQTDEREELQAKRLADERRQTVVTLRLRVLFDVVEPLR